MPKTENGRTVETATEARQAERGPSVLLVLGVSLALALVILGGLWLALFRA